MSQRTTSQQITSPGPTSPGLTRRRRLGAVVAVAAAVTAMVLLAPAASANAVVPPPAAIGTGTSGSVQLTPTLASGEAVAVTTTGFSAAQQLGEFAIPRTSPTPA